MRTYITILLYTIAFVLTSCEKDQDNSPIINFQDENFLWALLGPYNTIGNHIDDIDISADLDGDLKISEYEASRVTKIDYSRISGYDQISDMSEIKYFKSLFELKVSGQELKKLDVRENTNLNTLVCHYNVLEELDVNGCDKLKSLDCSNNRLKMLNLSGCDKIESLDCSENQLETLDVSECPELAILYCNDNQLKVLDISGCAYLIAQGQYDVSGNGLEKVYISPWQRKRSIIIDPVKGIMALYPDCQIIVKEDDTLP